MSNIQLFRLPFPASLVNALTAPIRRWLVRLSGDRYKRHAERVTGLSDYAADDGFELRFASTCAELQKLDLNLFGRVMMREATRWYLINRLNLVDLMKRQPEVFERPVEAPLIIIGLFRTGSTFLYNTLAADPNFRAGLTWEYMYPVGRKRDPLGDRGWRKRRAGIPIYGDRFIVPDRDAVHPVGLSAIEEDFFMLSTDMACLAQVMALGGFDYANKMLNWDMDVPYQWHKRQLQALSAQPSGRGGDATQWLMKCPWHMWHLDSLIKAYPDARIVHIHRDIVSTVGSECSLSARLYCRMSNTSDPHRVGEFWSDYSKEGLERGQRVKDSLPASQVYDVHLSDIKADPATQLKALYDHFDLPWSDSLSDTLVEASKKRHGLGDHTYELGDYGLTAEGIRAHFAEYEARFGRA